MNKLILTATLAASVGLAGCATTDPYGYGYHRHSAANGALTGAAVGAATGAVAGAVIPGVSVGAGAVAGGIAGAVIGAVVNGHQTYRTTTGRCYYTDPNGQVVYLPDNQC